MAIIDGVTGIEVTIWTGGRPAFEYADPDHNNAADDHGTKTSSKFIECRNGEEFTIHVRINTSYDHQQPVPHTLNIAVYIDGHWIRGELCRQNHLQDGPFRVDIKERVSRTRDGTIVKQAFKFAGVSTIDDNCNWRVENEREKVRDLGVIEIRVFRVQEMGSSTFEPDTNASRLAEVAEKSLKGRAISHGTQFSDELESPPGANNVPRYRDVKRLSTDAGPFAAYRFAYRSREGLCKEAIITEEQNEALKRAEDDRRQGSTRNQAPPAVATPPAARAPGAVTASPADRTLRAMRHQAEERLRDLGVDVPRFMGHRERAQRRDQPRRNEARRTKREPPMKGEDLRESKKQKVEKIIDLTSD